MVQEELPFKDISYLQLWRPLCSAEQNHLGNFGRGHFEEHFCEIILNLDQWFKKRSTWRSGVRSAMRAASQLPGKGHTDVDDAPAC